MLDEIDASLHPSMTRALLTTLQEVFVKRRTRVILATHSPSTVALAPEGSVHVVHKGPARQKIKLRPNKDALELLTEGFATLEDGLAVFNQIAKHEMCIITEGRNSNLIRKALQVLGQKDVEVVPGVEAVTGKDQLKTLFRIFCDAPIAKPVLFVWDCDVTFKLEDSGNAYALILPKNTANTVCQRGIENMFPDHLFTGFLSENKDSFGNVTTSFDPKRKRDFETHVLANATNDDYEQFKAIADRLNEIRNKVAPAEQGEITTA
jgi:hypothetical protein